MSKELREQIEKILFNGVVNAEELDITTDKIIKLFESKLKESKQLFCPHCSSKNILIPGDTNDYQCIECAFEWAK